MMDPNAHMALFMIFFMAIATIAALYFIGKEK